MHKAIDKLEGIELECSLILAQGQNQGAGSEKLQEIKAAINETRNKIEKQAQGHGKSDLVLFLNLCLLTKRKAVRRQRIIG